MNKSWKLITIYHIAEKTGLSASTVSRALNNSPVVKEKTTERVKKAAAELGFEFDNRSRPSNPGGLQTIAVIVPHLHQGGMSRIIQGMQDTAARVGYELLICQSFNSRLKERALIKHLVAKGVNGFLVCPAIESSPEIMPTLTQHSVPVQYFWHADTARSGSQISVNEFAAAYQLTTHLLSTGRISIGFIGDAPGYRSSKAYNGYLSALESYGIAPPADDWYKDLADVYDGSLIGKKIRTGPNGLDGLIVMDDVCALGCMQALQARGKFIPQDIAIAAFATTGVAALASTALTTIEFPYQQIGNLAADQLITQITEGPAGTYQQLRLDVGYQLIVRQSCASTVSNLKLTALQNNTCS